MFGSCSSQGNGFDEHIPGIILVYYCMAVGHVGVLAKERLEYLGIHYTQTHPLSQMRVE